MNQPPTICGGTLPFTLKCWLPILGGNVTLTWDNNSKYSGCANAQVFGGDPLAPPSSYFVTVPVKVYLAYIEDTFHFWLGYPTVSPTSPQPLAGKVCAQNWTGLSGFPNYNSTALYRTMTQSEYAYNEGDFKIVFPSPLCYSPDPAVDPCRAYWIYLNNIFSIPCDTVISPVIATSPIVYNNIFQFDEVYINHIRVCGGARVSRGLSFYSNGLGEIGPEFAGIRLSGISEQTTAVNVVGTGSIEVTPTAVSMISKYIYLATGGMSLAGQAIWTLDRWTYVSELGSEPTVMGSVEINTANYFYNALGVLISGGGADIALPIIAFDMNGGLEVQGEVGTVSPTYYYFPTGDGVSLSGECVTRNPNLGRFDIYAGGSAGLSEYNGKSIVIGYSIDENIGTIPADNLSITVACDCNPVAPIQSLKHEFGAGGLLKEFLFRNGLKVAPIQKLYYDQIFDSWSCNIVLNGISTFEDVSEQWNLIFEAGCTSFLGGYELGSLVWKFGFTIRRTRDGKTSDTRFLSSFVNNGPCLNGPLRLKFTWNTQTNTIQTEPIYNVQSLVVNDAMGFFKNAYYQAFPEMKFNLAVSQVPTNFTRLDSGVVYPPRSTYPEA